jgi:predicted lipoprotein
LASLLGGSCSEAPAPRDSEPTPVPAQPTATVSAPFDAIRVADKVWETDLAAALDHARDAAKVAVALAADAAGAAETYGVNRESGVPHVVVHGEGWIVSVAARGRTGTATVELEGDGRPRVLVQIGPVLRGTALRDALASLDADRFANQIQHSDVGYELNARVEREVLAGVDTGALRRKRVRFAGVAPLEPGQPLTITPLRFEIVRRRR